MKSYLSLEKKSMAIFKFLKLFLSAYVAQERKEVEEEAILSKVKYSYFFGSQKPSLYEENKKYSVLFF